MDASKLPPAPNLFTIGTDEGCETILYTGKTGNNLTGCTRGFDGTTAKAWVIGSKVARYYTAADHNAFKANIEDLDARTGRVDLTQTLGPGLSLVTADQNGSELDLVVNGRTLVNLLGKDGNFEVDSNSNGLADGLTGGSPATYSLVPGRYGTNAQRITSGTTDTSVDRRVSKTSLSASAGKYVFIADAMTDGTNGLMGMSVYNNNGYVTGSGTSASTTWKTIFVRFTLATDTTSLAIHLYNQAPAGTVGWAQYDGAGVYAVDDALYARIGVDITESNIRDYLPHVDGKQHVQGVAITKQGRNLLGPFAEWTQLTNSALSGPYSLTLTAAGQYQGPMYKLNALPNQAYTLSATHNGRLEIQQYDANGTSILNQAFTAQTATITTNAAVASIIVRCTNSAAGTFTFSNPQLELGSAATPFTPAEPQSVILPVTLGEVGGIRDSVYSKGSEWMYMERVKKGYVLDGSLSWSFGSDGTGLKKVYTTRPSSMIASGPFVGAMLRYDGKLMKSFDTSTADGFDGGGAGTFIQLSIADIDAGWAETINPNINAIKALFNGWKAAANNGTVYTSWVSILDGSAPATNTEAWVSANKASGWTGWATLDYALASAAVPVAVTNAEGSITLHPGGNQISVDTGLIQREKVTPVLYAPDNKYYINAVSTSSKPKYRVQRFLSIYKGAEVDSAWGITPHNAVGEVVFGSVALGISVANFDSTKDYYVTYIALDKYGLTANVTETAATWRTGLSGVVSDVVQSVAELRQADDRQDFADDYIEAKADNLRLDFTAHESDFVRHPGYGLATGVNAKTITLSPAFREYLDGVGVVFKNLETNTGAVTINVNGLGAKPILKANGSAPAAGSLKAGIIYTVRYNGTAFILQGEGGEGTAVAGDIRAGKTAETIAGTVTGSLPVQTGGTVTPTTSVQTKAAGIYDTPITVSAVNAPANKILSDTIIAGVQGGVPVKGAYTDADLYVTNSDGKLYVGIPQGAYQTNGGSGYPEILIPQARVANAIGIAAGDLRLGKSALGVVGTMREYYGGAFGVNFGSPGPGSPPPTGYHEIFRVPAGWTNISYAGYINQDQSSTNIFQKQGIILQDIHGNELLLAGYESNGGSWYSQQSGLFIDRVNRQITSTNTQGGSNNQGGWYGNTDIGANGTFTKPFNLDNRVILYFKVEASMGGGYTSCAASGKLAYN
ncbi:hypothetical protein [Paenibacillus graminis]|uniref:hypothetical protein n=1 Tax=Paenibacillus graminis TaxID=189425 RepID=UPI0012DFE043|nr:hypothetical protein [Paenibacillus graminis]